MDALPALEFIRTHPLKDQIIEMYKRGPPEDTGFMWLREGWFTKEQQQGFQVMRAWVLDHGYDSSAYGFMHRAIQHALVRGQETNADAEPKQAPSRPRQRTQQPTANSESGRPSGNPPAAW